MATRKITKGQTTQCHCVVLPFVIFSFGHCVVCPFVIFSFGHCVFCPFVLFLLAIVLSRTNNTMAKRKITKGQTTQWPKEKRTNRQTTQWPQEK
jgi:hypothetical protein